MCSDAVSLSYFSKPHLSPDFLTTASHAVLVGAIAGEKVKSSDTPNPRSPSTGTGENETSGQEGRIDTSPVGGTAAAAATAGGAPAAAGGEVGMQTAVAVPVMVASVAVASSEPTASSSVDRAEGTASSPVGGKHVGVALAPEGLQSEGAGSVVGAQTGGAPLVVAHGQEIGPVGLSPLVLTSPSNAGADVVRSFFAEADSGATTPHNPPDASVKGGGVSSNAEAGSWEEGSSSSLERLVHRRQLSSLDLQGEDGGFLEELEGEVSQVVRFNMSIVTGGQSPPTPTMSLFDAT